MKKILIATLMVVSAWGSDYSSESQRLPQESRLPSPRRGRGAGGEGEGDRHNWERRAVKSSILPQRQVAVRSSAGFLPGARVLLDAHNCYPENGQWTDRLTRALKTGLPIAIEQDLAWYTDKATGRSWSVVVHHVPPSGSEPTLQKHFFEQIRPMVERALRDQDRKDWPLITLNLDFKSEEPEHLEFIWKLLGEYESWLCTAPRTGDAARTGALELRPLLVLTGSSDAQQKVFHDAVPIESRLRLFGAAKVAINAETSLDPSVPSATNYRRWWNNPWSVVEKPGQRNAGDWTQADAARLQSLVRTAHAKGLWIRFYTLNGHAESDALGWTQSYNFGSLDQARLRWQAAIEAGVDFIATDQYEAFSELRSKAAEHSPGRVHRSAQPVERALRARLVSGRTPEDAIPSPPCEASQGEIKRGSPSDSLPQKAQRSFLKLRFP